VSFNTVISACVGRLKWQHALALFELMRLKNLHRDAVSWSSCITACAQGQSAEAALQLYDEYSNEATQLNTVVVNAAMAACGASRTWQRAVALTHQLQYAWQALSQAPDEVSFNTTIAVCAAGQ
ncbi:PCMP-E8, partial [Symbiodinium sp. CCMP2456]